jgi:hypothetical protein
MQNVFDSDTRFFQTLSNSRRLRGFAGENFSTGEFPEAGKWYAFRSLPDQETAILLNDGDGDFDGHTQPRRAIVVYRDARSGDIAVD